MFLFFAEIYVQAVMFVVNIKRLAVTPRSIVPSKMRILLMRNDIMATQWAMEVKWLIAFLSV